MMEYLSSGAFKFLISRITPPITKENYSDFQRKYNEMNPLKLPDNPKEFYGNDYYGINGSDPLISNAPSLVEFMEIVNRPKNKKQFEKDYTSFRGNYNKNNVTQLPEDPDNFYKKEVPGYMVLMETRRLAQFIHNQSIYFVISKKERERVEKLISSNEATQEDLEEMSRIIKKYANNVVLYKP